MPSGRTTETAGAWRPLSSDLPLPFDTGARATTDLAMGATSVTSLLMRVRSKSISVYPQQDGNWGAGL